MHFVFCTYARMYFSSYCAGGGVFFVLFILNSTVSIILFSTRAIYFKSHLLRLIGLPLNCWRSFLTRLHLFSFVLPSIFFVFLPHNIYICVSLYLYLRPTTLVNAPHYFCILWSKLFLTKFADYIMHVWASPHHISTSSRLQRDQIEKELLICYSLFRIGQAAYVEAGCQS